MTNQDNRHCSRKIHMTTAEPKLTFNCPENWEKMKIGLTSRYCDNCKRDVQDFTNLTKEEILHFLWTNRTNKVCGRIYKPQLDYHREEILITIESLILKNKNSNLSFYLLAIGTTMLLACSTDSRKEKAQTNDTLAVILNGQGNDLKKADLTKKENCKIDSILPDDFPLVGEIAINDTITQINGVRIFAEVMPEFVGGFDSLVSYIKENLKYPEWEKREKIEGNVFVSFTVDKNGEIIDPKILKSVDGSKNFDNEVIRIIKAMPNWNPGQEQGQNVAVQFTLPIKFKL